ncbi:uncharacterized protein LOC109837342 [Asparagus officinalis]|uniref:uncharacterized protein LOC109837342 n=1 Tax=Asparagus officinalis TaxID=4686 RepID=UPI00098E1F31|nr:uncharacterized protein LOC109837342 [Asparagus officinalis]
MKTHSNVSSLNLVSSSNPIEISSQNDDSGLLGGENEFPPLVISNGKEANDSPLILESNEEVPVSDPENNRKSWVSFFKDNRKPRNGFNLNYIQPDIKDSVTFDEDEWNEGGSIWKFSLIGQVLGLNIKYKAMETYVKKIWGSLALPEICLLKPGLFLFKFKNLEDMSIILENGPWFLGSRPLLLKSWSIDDELEKRKDSVYPVWIHLPGLRLNLWNERSISKIASLIGKPITTDKLTANRQRLAYARVLVEVTLPSSLPDEIHIQGPNGKK